MIPRQPISMVTSIAGYSGMGSLLVNSNVTSKKILDGASERCFVGRTSLALSVNLPVQPGKGR